MKAPLTSVDAAARGAVAFQAVPGGCPTGRASLFPEVAGTVGLGRPLPSEAPAVALG